MSAGFYEPERMLNSFVGGDGGCTNRKKVMIVAKLTAKQQRFCDEYLIDLNATQAAIRAGYSEQSARQMGTENLSKPSIKEYIDQRMSEMEAELVADSKEVMRYLTSVLRGQAQSEIVVIEGSGNGQSEARLMMKAPDENQRLKAAELLGKAHMMFTEKVQQEVDVDLNITVDYGDAE